MFERIREIDNRGNNDMLTRFGLFAFVGLFGISAYTYCNAAESAADEEDSHLMQPGLYVQPGFSERDNDIESRTGQRKMTCSEREVLKRELRDAMEKAYSPELRWERS